MKQIHPYVDIAVFTIHEAELKVLLVPRPVHEDEPFPGKLALPGGYVKLSESAPSVDDCAKQELLKKAGLELKYIEQVQTVGSTIRDPRGPSMTTLYFAIVNDPSIIDTLDTQAGWVSIDDSVDLAFDHDSLVQLAVDRLRSKLRYTDLAMNFVGEKFTLSELQEVFETILKISLSKASFRNRMLRNQAVVETKEFRTGAHRPAQLFMKNPKTLFIFGRLLEGQRNFSED